MGFDTGAAATLVCWHKRKLCQRIFQICPGGAMPPKPAEAAKVQPKKETVRINLPPKPTSAPTIKLPTLAPGGPSSSAGTAAPVAPTAAPAAPAARRRQPPAAAPPSRAGATAAARPPARRRPRSASGGRVMWRRQPGCGKLDKVAGDRGGGGGAGGGRVLLVSGFGRMMGFSLCTA